jgi:hypothetical protein
VGGAGWRKVRSLWEKCRGCVRRTGERSERVEVLTVEVLTVEALVEDAVGGPG